MRRPARGGEPSDRTGHAPTLASALSTSSFNVGTAIGSWIAGYALASALGTTGPVIVGAVIAALYFIPLPILLVLDRREARHVA